jgi:hypothetical protein
MAPAGTGATAFTKPPTTTTDDDRRTDERRLMTVGVTTWQP